MLGHDKILVTGAGGFIGSHLVEELLRREQRVRAFVRYSSNGGIGCLQQLPPSLLRNLEVFHGDIRDSRAVRQAVAGCRRIYHLAALIGIPYSYTAPDSYVAVNIQGTLNILEAGREREVERIIVTSTSEVYGTALYAPIDENHPLQAQSPYAATKIGADHLALSYQRAFGLPVTVVRPFNTYGPRQSTRAVIPTIMTQALAGDAVHLGSLSPVRDLVYVRDTVAGFLALGDAPTCIGRATNLATGVGVTIGELAQRIVRLVGRPVPIREAAERVRPETSEVFKLIGSARLAGEAGCAPPRRSTTACARRSTGFGRTFRPSRSESTGYESRHPGRRARQPAGAVHYRHPQAALAGRAHADPRNHHPPTDRGRLRPHYAHARLHEHLLPRLHRPASLAAPAGENRFRRGKTTDRHSRFAGRRPQPARDLSGHERRLADFPGLPALFAHHLQHRPLLTIGQHRKDIKIDLGVVKTDDAGYVTDYVEKPVLSYGVSMGVYIYDAEALSYIEPGEFVDFPTLVHRLLAAGKKVHTYPSEATWLDLGRYEDLQAASEMFLQREHDFLPKSRQAA